jgi:hypothetical protein
MSSTPSSSTSPRVSVVPSPLAVPPDAESFNILPLSDLHLPSDLESARRVLHNQTYLRRMNHVLLLGDMCATYGTNREYSQLDKFVRQLERPYSAVNGNHEFYFEVIEEDEPQAHHTWQEQGPEGKTRQLQKFMDFFGYDSLWRATHTHLGSFIFLGLDDVENHKVENLSDRQLRFLEEQVRVAPDVPAFVFCHVPVMFETRLDMIYYEPERTACVELQGRLAHSMIERAAPVFWMSGHIHLRPDHYMFDAYLAAPNVWQVHCPDSWGYSRWTREQIIPQRHSGLFSRHLEIGRDSVALVAHDHCKREDIARQTVFYAP